MNRELLHRVADHIDAFPESFDLSRWADIAESTDLCDTVGCVAGWAVMLSDPAVRAELVTDILFAEEFPWNAQAAHYLELDGYSAEVLFTSGRWWARQMWNLGFTPILERVGDEVWSGEYVHLDSVPPKAAATILRAVAEGEINLDGLWLD